MPAGPHGADSGFTRRLGTDLRNDHPISIQYGGGGPTAADADGEYQGAVYDVAVSPEAQGQGIGKVILQTILDRLPDCNIMLYATPGMEGFYENLGFGRMKTAMALFTTPQAMEKFTT